jgi:hypothetical protein
MKHGGFAYKTLCAIKTQIFRKWSGGMDAAAKNKFFWNIVDNGF